MKKIIFITIFVLSILVLIFFNLSYADDSFYYSADSENRINDQIITEMPFIIDKPGNYYVSGLFHCNESGIIIQSSDVSLIGLGGIIEGNNTPGSMGLLIASKDEKFSNITIQNISFRDFDIGVKIENASLVTVNEGIISSNSRGGLYIDSSSEITISQGEIKNNWNDISGGLGVRIDNSDTVVFENLIVSGNGKSGKTNSGGVLGFNSENVIIRNSEILLNPGYGIRLEDGCQYAIISKNDITSNSGDGIFVNNCSDTTIRDNKVDKNKNSGIKLNNALYPAIRNNRISSGSIGISIINTLNMTLSDNVLLNNRIGFDISGTELSHYHHQISSTNTIDSRKLLYLNNQNNKVIGPGDNPATILAVNCTGLKISDIIFSKNGAGLFLVNSHNITLSDLTFIENGIGVRSEYGTSNLNGSSLHAERNLVTGYFFSDTHHYSLQSVYAQDSPSGVLILNSTQGSLYNVYIDSITGIKTRKPSGITVSGSENVSISDSSFSHCQYAGLISDSENLTITRSLFKENDYAGAIILSGPVQLHDNTFIKNTENGLILRTNDSEIFKNTFSQNEKRGLLILQGNGSIFIGNIFNNTKNCEISGTDSVHIWNSSPALDGETSPNGGNFWGDPEGQGYSDICPNDSYGFCTDPYIVNPENIDFKPLSTETTWTTLFIKTDLNQNGREDLQDVVTYMNYVTSGQTDSLYDFSGDGRINLNDVVAVFKRISEK